MTSGGVTTAAAPNGPAIRRPAPLDRRPSGLPADRRARDHRRPPHRGAGRQRRHDRLVLPGSVRRAECLRGAAGSRPGRLLPDRARGSARCDEAALPSRHQCPGHAVSLPGGRGRGSGFHARGRRPAAADPKRGRGAWRSRGFVSRSSRGSTMACTSRSSPSSRTGVVFRAPGQALALGSPVGLEPTGAGARAEFEVAAGERRTFVLQAGDRPVSLSAQEAEALGDETVMFWRQWLRQSSYQGRWREMVDRSALTLKLLSYEPSGAIVAAPTTSLPEEIGGRRNWDYRYAWLRDFAFSIYALSRLGFTAEATAFNRFRLQISNAAAGRDEGSPLDVMYRIDGGGCLAERELEHLDGYRGSASGKDRQRRRHAAAARRLRRAVRLDLPRRASGAQRPRRRTDRLRRLARTRAR